MKIQFPFDFSKLGPGPTSATVLTPDLIDELVIVPSQPTPIFAPHDGKLTDRADLGDVLILAGKYGSGLSQFILDAKFVGAKDVAVKKGEQIGFSGVSPGTFKWQGLLPKASTADKADLISCHPLIMAGALGGIEFPGMANAQGYTDDLAKGLKGLFAEVGKLAVAFGLGWLIGKK